MYRITVSDKDGTQEYQKPSMSTALLFIHEDCPGKRNVQQTIKLYDPDGQEIKNLFDLLFAKFGPHQECND